jgi:phosphatidylinositol glycan class O
MLTFSDIMPLALLGLHVFFGTGHQSVISTIQWKTAFILTPTVTYLFSPATVMINSFGPQFLVGLAAPLLALWNRVPLTPTPPPQAPSNARGAESPAQVKYTLRSTDGYIRADVMLAGLGMMLYYECLLLGTAVSAALLRRHLMVWKVFAPRFMSAVVGVLVVDVGVLLGVGVGVARVGWGIRNLFSGVKA